MRNSRQSLSTLIVGFAAVFLSLALSSLAAAEPWPQRPVRVVVPVAPGTALDVSARLYAEQLGKRWGQPVIVENIPGADAMIAIKEFVSKHDDHALLYCHAGPISINPMTYSTLPYDPANDLVPISSAADNFLSIAASANLNVETLADLAKFGRNRPGKLSWAATPGLTYFAFVAFQKNADFSAVHIPYRDLNQALLDVGESRIDAVSTSLAPLIPHARAGKVRLLAVINRMRAPVAPDVPTAAQAGYPTLSFDGISGFYGWRDMPTGLRERIAADVRAVAADPTIVARLVNAGSVARGSTPAEFAAAIEDQRAKVADIAQAVGAKPTQSKSVQ